MKESIQVEEPWQEEEQGKELTESRSFLLKIIIRSKL